MGERVDNMGKMLSNPKQRNMYFMIIGAAVFTLTVGLYFVTANSNKAMIKSTANVTSVPNINATPGSSTSPEYKKKVQESNATEADLALKNNTSFIPTPTGDQSSTDISPIDLIDKQKAEAKKLKDEQDTKDAEELARVQQVEREKIAQSTTVKLPIPQVVQYPQQKLKKYSNEDYMVLAALIENTKAKQSASEFNFAGVKETNMISGNNAPVNGQINDPNQPVQPVQTVVQAPIAKAGTIFNAILESGINSDEPSPILAKIISGPLNGTELIGSIQTVGEKVVLQFSVANIPSQQASQSISAVAIDPATTRTALASDVDHHYLAKYGVLFASSFLSGWSKAIMASNTVTQTNPLTGTPIVTQGQLSTVDINKVAIGNVGTAIADQAKTMTQDIKPTIKVNSGMAIGVLLMSDLIIK
jgi:type IV secretory pathway VirB10-like protein